MQGTLLISIGLIFSLLIPDPDRVHNSFWHNQVQVVLQRVRDHPLPDGLPRRGHPLLLDGRVHLQEESPHGSQVQSSPITQPNRYLQK